jgi:DNA-binding NarL/FixJ family response regulator
LNDEQKMRIFIAAPVRLYRDGLAEVFGRDARFEVWGSAATRLETLAFVHGGDFDIVLVDADLPGAGALVREVAQRPCDPKVGVLGVEEAREEILPLVEAGITGYVTREGSIADLFASVECAVRGESVASPRMVATLMKQVASLTRERRSSQEAGILTTRERQIAGLIEEGLSNRDIARRLEIELPTVKNHVHNILEKLHVHRRGEAAARLRTASAQPISRRRG